MAEKKQKKAVAKKAAKKVILKKAAKNALPKKVAKKTSVSSTPKKTTVKKAIARSSKTPAKLAHKKTAAKKATITKPLKKKARSVTKKTVKKASSKKAKDDEECFLTTACVNYYSLADDAYELMTLRKFRDQYLLKSKEGDTLVKRYYSIAPLIVSMIDKDKEHKTVYQYIYASIQKACREIEQQKFRIAQETYVSLVNQLSKKYKIGF